MSTEPPVRYENYPPDQNEQREEAPGVNDPHSPVVRPYVPATIPAPPAGRGSSRRTLIGLVIGIPVAGMLLSAIAASGRAGGVFNDGFTDDTDDDTDMDSGDEEIDLGDYSADVPAGWTVSDDGSGTVEVWNGSNRLTAVLLNTESYTPAVDEIARLADGHYTGFTGKIGDPVDRSSADVQHATMDGTGKFRGQAARLLTELWIDDGGTGLLVARVVTAKAPSAIYREAQAMVDELSQDF